MSIIKKNARSVRAINRQRFGVSNILLKELIAKALLIALVGRS